MIVEALTRIHHRVMELYSGTNMQLVVIKYKLICLEHGTCAI